MTLLSAKDAAILAQSVYAVLPAASAKEALTFVKRDAAFGKSPTPGPKLSEPIVPISGMLGKSGAFVKKETGFGVVCERNGINGRELIFVFRGTQSNFDWASNFNIGYDLGPGGATVHSGFNRIYKTMREDIAREITDSKPAAVHMVGHSLGGALASLACLDFIAGKPQQGYLYTFGAPRVGTVGTASRIKSAMAADSVKRVYSLSDPVPMIPLFPYMHSSAGSTGLADGFSFITADAHSMKGNYVPSMPASGWPTAIAMPNKADPSYWLAQAVKSSSISKGYAYVCLSAALTQIMGALSLLGFGVSSGMTVLDGIAQGLANGVLLSKAIGETVLKFVKAAMIVLGLASLVTAVAVVDLTSKFLRYVLDLLLAPVRMAALAADKMLS